MGLVKILKSTSSHLFKYGKTKVINKTKLLKNLELVEADLVIIEKFLTSLTIQDRVKLRAKVLENVNHYRELDDSFKNLTNDSLLNRSNQVKNIKKAYGAIEQANSAFKNIVTQAIENVDDFFQEDSVEFDRIRLSHTMFLSIIESAKLFSKFTTYYFDTCTTIATNEVQFNNTVKQYDTEPLSIYKIDYLAENAKEYINILNSMADKKGKFYILDDIKNIKTKSMYDVPLSEVKNTPVSILSGFTKMIPNNTLGLYTGFLDILNPITLVGSTWIQYQHYKHERRKYYKEWMEAKVAILKIELNDPNNPKKQEEKVKYQKIIDRYDDLIKKLDRDIEKYENE